MVTVITKCDTFSFRMFIEYCGVEARSFFISDNADERFAIARNRIFYPLNGIGSLRNIPEEFLYFILCQHRVNIADNHHCHKIRTIPRFVESTQGIIREALYYINFPDRQPFGIP